MPAARASSASAARFTAASSSAFSAFDFIPNNFFISTFLYRDNCGEENMAVNLRIN
jgi:hypothetical protein